MSKKLRGRLSTSRLSKKRRRPLRLENLERRQLLAAYVVDTDSSADDGNFAAGNLSLREAINQANANPGADTITFGDGSASGGTNFTDDVADTIVTNNAELLITDSLTIIGPGSDKLIISGENQTRIFKIDNGDLGSLIDVEISGITATNGNASGSGGAIESVENLTIRESKITNNSAAGTAGGIFADSTGTLKLIHSELTGNTAASFGGAVVGQTNATVVVSGSTIAGNTGTAGGGFLLYTPNNYFINTTIVNNRATQFNGGGIVTVANTRIINSTISGNTAIAGRTAGIQQYGSSQAHVDNSIVVGNINDSAQAATDIIGNINATSSNNVFTNAAYPNVNGQLVNDWKTVIENNGTVPVLDDNGGLVRTVALEPGSVAIDNGSDALAVDESGQTLVTDARGGDFLRKYGSVVDIGAVESQPIPGAFGVSATSSSVTVDEGSTASNTGTFTAADISTVTLTASLGTLTVVDDTWSWSYNTNDGPDDSATVTITATDSSDGSVATTTFDLTVSNVAPTVAATSATVTVNEGSTATNSGTFADLGDDVVTITASVGSITQGSGTWSWSYNTTDGPDDSQTVTITATDSDGATSTTTFALVVDNVAPTVGVDAASVSAAGGQQATNTGTFSDPGNDTVAITASIGTVSLGAGTWSWVYSTSSTPDDSQTVTITATDSDGAVSTVTFDLVVTYFSIAADSTSVTVDEGTTATNTGTFVAADVSLVTFTASVGTVSVVDDTWSWSFDTTDGPGDSGQVLITATDSDGTIATASFALNVNNVAPTVAADSSSVTVDEGGTATNTGTFADAGDEAVTITASVGTVTQVDGTWSWSYDTSDGPDDSQTVTITATDNDGATSTTTFALVVNNVAPTVAANTATVTVNEGSTATNSGTFDDAGDDTVVITSSIGSITQGAGTWNWSYNTNDGPDDSQTVTITATDSDGAITTTTFALVVDNVAPTVAANNATVSVNEGSTASNSGTYNDPGDDTVIITASVGTIIQNAGTWDWSYDTSDGPDQSQTVTITATDSDGAVTATTFALVVNNVAPTVAADNATVTVNEADTATNSGTFNDVGNDTVLITSSIGSITQGAGTWNWSYDTSDGPDESQTVTITATDSDGAVTTTTFALVVNNVAPTVAANNATVTVNESDTATNSGTFNDVGDDTVVITSSIGSITQGVGTWNWSYDTSDGPDESQTVTITATDSDGAVTTTTFTLVVNNVAPTVAANNATVTVNESDTATNSGTFNDVGDDTVVITSSIGSITQGAGTWNWSYDTSDGPDESQTVTITATDSDGAVTTTTFALVVNNVAPTVAANNATVTVNEADTASNSGTFNDVGDDTVVITSSIGSITQDAGTWNWSYDTSDGPDESQTVTITATDSDGAVTTTTFTLVVNNVAPTVAANNATVTVNEADTASNSGTFNDVGDDTVVITSSIGSITQGAGTWNWSYDTSDGPDESQTVTITATDSDGAVTTTTFTLVVNNVAPTVAANSASVTVNESDTATNSGTFADVGDDTVVITSSIGSITQGAGTWNWSYDTSDGPDDSQTVTITATDSDGAVTTTTFALIVNNVAPTVAANAASVTVNEADTATNSGTFADVGDDTVVITSSIGSITQGAGTWNWSYDTSDGPDDSQTVTITATDSDGAVTTTTFALIVNNVAPTVAANNATVTVNESDTATNSGTFNDVGDDTVVITSSIGSITQGAGTWNWSYDTSDGPDESQTVTITATDSDGAVTTTTFTLVVNNVAPTVAANNATVTVNESDTATNSGTFNDVGDDTVVITSSIGSITQGAGTWNWSYDTSDGPDESQTVTITATDSDGAVTATTFALVVNNVAPTVAANNATVTVNEADTATNSGTFNDVGNDTVLITSSIGSITQGAGTWNWSYDTSDGPDESQTVTITATDSDGAVTTTTFALVVNNVAPTVAVNNASVTVNESDIAYNSGTFGDIGDDTVTISSSIGSVTQSAGTWNWSFQTTDGPDETQTVTITATDSDGAVTTTTFSLIVNNVAPAMGLDKATETVDEGTLATNSGSLGDVGDDVMSLSASIGTVTQQNGSWNWQFSTSFPEDSQTVTITATDSDGAATSVSFELVVEPVEASVRLLGKQLVVRGTDGDDRVSVSKHHDKIVVDANFDWGRKGKTKVTFAPSEIDSIRIILQDGDDTANIEGKNGWEHYRGGLTFSSWLPSSGDQQWYETAVIEGGDGDDILRGGNYRDIITGGAGRDYIEGRDGDDVLSGGDGRDWVYGGRGDDVATGGDGRDTLNGGRGHDVLIGGQARDFIIGSRGDDLLVATEWLHEDDLDAIDAIANEWTRNDATYSEKLDHLTGEESGGLNGAYLLDSSSLPDDDAKDYLIGNAGTDAFFAAVHRSLFNWGRDLDEVIGKRRNEVIIRLF